jgi:argininosuccinate lyase
MTSESQNDTKRQRLWGGRFTGATDPVMERFNNSIGYDKTMWREDIEGSKQYARALEKCNILTTEELDR